MQTRYLLAILGSTALLGLVIWKFSAEDAAVSCGALTPTPTIVAFGDSLVEGRGSTKQGGFVTLLQEREGIPIKNLGVSGDTTLQAKERVSQVRAAAPDVVIVLLGGNDALRRVDPETTKANLDAVLASFNEGGAQIVLVGVVGGLPFKDPYPAMYEELAEQYDAVYVDNVLSGLIGRAEYMSDSVHPNDAGYARIADRVLPALNTACAKL